MTSQKESYVTLCEEVRDIPLFSQAWWLDAVCDRDGWDVVLVEKGGVVVGALPFIRRKRFLVFSIISRPPLTPCLGPWVRHTCGAKYSSRLATEKEVITELFDRLGKFDMYEQSWSKIYTNWLPLYWRGFSQTTRYTYTLEDLTDLDRIYGDFQGGVRKEIKKAAKLGVYIDNSATLEDFIELNGKVFKRQGLLAPYSKRLVIRLFEAAQSKGQASYFVAKDVDGNAHAGVFLVWDKDVAYYLMGGGDPCYRNSGATSLCMWMAIKHAAVVSKSFDFEGSMIEPIERFFRGFGAKQRPYHSVYKCNSRILKTLSFAKGLIRG